MSGKTGIFVAFFIWWLSEAAGQMRFMGQDLYGNEWIRPGQTYWKIPVGEDGIYRISAQVLEAAGIPLDKVAGGNFRLYKLGKEVPMIRSTTGLLGPSGYLMFYGSKNRGELDEALFDKPEEMGNPQYSMFTDTAIYFLHWEDQPGGMEIALIPNDLSAPVPKDPYYRRRAMEVLHESSFKRGVSFGSDQKFPLFDAAQGFISALFRSRDFALNFPAFYASGPDVTVRVRLTGFGDDNTSHRANFYLDGISKGTEIFAGYKVRTKELSIPSFDVRQSMSLRIAGEASPEDKLAIAHIEYEYPATFDFQQAKWAQMHIDKGIIRKYIELEQFDGGDEISVFDLTNGYYLNSQRETNGTYRITLPESNVDREVIAWNASEVREVGQLHPFIPETSDAGDYDFIILYHPAMAEPVGGTNYVEAYANYRASSAGGSFRVATVSIAGLYDQFAYGIHTHSLAVRNFAQFARTIWPGMRYFLIMGKGLEYPYYRENGPDPAYFFVPTFGTPAADIVLVSDRDYRPFCSFGRLPVVSGNEIKTYLDKLRSHEAYLSTTTHEASTREWLKRIVHLSGGDPSIYALISAQLTGMEGVIENNLMGARVETFYKQSSSTIEVANSELLRKFINEGSSIITFMGHSAAVRLDFNLENVDSYLNKDRYHLFMALGCYAGSLFAPNRSISEEHNLAPERGSILYVANTTAGFPDILGLFGSEFYRQLGETSYGMPVGDALRETLLKLAAQGGERLLTQAYSTTLNGDPAVRLNLGAAPDFTVDPASVGTDPATVFATHANVDLQFDVINLGNHEVDSLDVIVERQFPNGGRSIVFDGRIARPSVRQKVHIAFPGGGEDAVGYNLFFVQLDPANRIDEGPQPWAEQNNELEIQGKKGYTTFVFGNEARPVQPPEFAILQTDAPLLIAGNSNTLAFESTYYFELDTTEYFDSPLREQYSVKQTGGVLQWKPQRRLLPDKVYYWRVSPDSLGSGRFAWRSSSLIYLPGSSPGWNQSHFFQWQKNELQKMRIDEPTRNWQYSPSFIEFRATNGYIELPSFIRPRVYVGNDVAADYEYWKYNTGFSGIVVNVFNPVNGALWVNTGGGDFNSYADARFQGQRFFVFKTETREQRQALMQFLLQDVPNDHVVVFSALTQYQHSYFPEQWETDGPVNLVTTLESFGAKQVRSLRSFPSAPYVLVFRKGRSDFEVKEHIGNFTDESEVAHVFTIPQESGMVRSQLIGPASSWGAFHWLQASIDAAQDVQDLRVLGVGPSGNEQLLASSVPATGMDLSMISAAEFPVIRLEWRTSDSISRTPPALAYWRVDHRSLPDAAFNPVLGFKKDADTLDQGDLFSAAIFAQNIGAVAMDSLLVKFTLVSQDNRETTQYARFKPLGPMESVEIPFSFSTSSVYGAYKLFIELNPDDDQPEGNLFNNTAILPFYVRRDILKPYMDVTFDRNRIVNLEIVSSKALIELTLRKDHHELLLNDTAAFVIRIKEPGGNPQRVYFSQANVHFFPASQGNPQVRATIEGNFTRDGVHTLYVSAYDAAGNAATDKEFLVDFTVVTKSSVGNLFNYPNPFTSKTRFVYTITGEKVPEDYSLQIMTVSGKVVREIGREELGPLRIGTHMTSFAYDGTDQFGDRLANGVYLYRFRVRSADGASWDKYDTDTDAYFKGNFGKMVILR